MYGQSSNVKSIGQLHSSLKKNKKKKALYEVPSQQKIRKHEVS